MATKAKWQKLPVKLKAINQKRKDAASAKKIVSTIGAFVKGNTKSKPTSPASKRSKKATKKTGTQNGKPWFYNRGEKTSTKA